jgi:phage gp45-like
MRTSLNEATRTAQQGTSRATIREVSDDHLMQEVKQADVFHGETPTDFERWQMVGMTSVPLKQQTQQQSKQAQSDEQPRGPAAEALMIYVNGQRSHPVAIVDDRRVRPYGMKPGQGAMYAPDGSEQMVHFRQDGTYVVSLDGKSVEEPSGNRSRMVSVRHVTKDMQSHKIDGNSQQPDYPHHGKAVNTEVRLSAGKIEFYDGSTLVGAYDKASKTWVLETGPCILTVAPDKIVGQYGTTTKFAVNSIGAQIKRGVHHASITDDGNLTDRPWVITPDPMQGI